MDFFSRSPSSSAEREASAPILSTRGLRFAYPGGVVALEDVSIDFVRGRKTVVMGHNGSGKTTLLSVLAGLSQQAAGEVSLKGRDLRSSPADLRELRRTVGMVFQDPDSQVFSAAVYEDVSFGPMNMRLPVGEVRARVERSLAALDITELADRPVHALSYGQRKRVSIAGVLAMHPEVVLLDEPLAALDPPSARSVTRLLGEMHARGTTLIVSTHDIDFAYEWADDAVVLDEGRVHVAGPARKVIGMTETNEALGTSPFVLDVARAAGLHDAGEVWSRSALLEALADMRVRRDG